MYSHIMLRSHIMHYSHIMSHTTLRFLCIHSFYNHYEHMQGSATVWVIFLGLSKLFLNYWKIFIFNLIFIGKTSNTLVYLCTVALVSQFIIY